MDSRSSSCRREILMLGGLVLTLSLMGARSLPKKRPIGLTLDWNSNGSDIQIRRVRMAGIKNEPEANTFVSQRASRATAYVPGDFERFPDWIEVEWLYDIFEPGKINYAPSPSRATPGHARFNLQQLIPQSAIEAVWKDRARKQLKLILTFNDEQLDLRYQVHQWRA